MSDAENKTRDGWDGQPLNPAREGWHLLRRKARPEFGVREEELPWLYVPGYVGRYNGADVTPWHLPQGGSGSHVYRERDVAWNWTYVGPMEVHRA